MTKIRAFDLSLTMAAFAALVFLLPADRESIANETEQRQTMTQNGSTKTADTHQRNLVSKQSI